MIRKLGITDTEMKNSAGPDYEMLGVLRQN